MRKRTGVLLVLLSQGARADIASLPDKTMLVRTNVVDGPASRPRIEVVLAYDHRHCAGELHGGLGATLNGRPMAIYSRGSMPHLARSELAHYRTKCGFPTFTAPRLASDEAAAVTVIEIFDDSARLRAEFDGLFTPREIALKDFTELHRGNPAAVQWLPAQDRFLKLTDGTWVGGLAPSLPRVLFRYDADAAPPWADEHPSVQGSRVEFRVPANASGGTGTLTVQEGVRDGVWSEARQCSGPVHCLALPLAQSLLAATLKLTVAGPAPIRKATSTLFNQVESRYTATTTLLDDGRVLLAGGVRSGRHLASAELWDPKKQQWAATAPMRGTRSSHLAIGLPGGAALVVGGVSFDCVGSNDCECGDVGARSEIWDPTTDAWASAGCLPKGTVAAREVPLLALPDGRIVAAAHEESLGGDSLLVVFDRAQRSWSALSRFPRLNDYGLVPLSDGRLLRIGGSKPLTGPEHLSEVATFDPKSRKWATAAPLQAARHSFSTISLSDGRILVAGGDAVTTRENRGKSELFDPQRGVWEYGPRWPRRFQPPLAVLRSGERVVAIATHTPVSSLEAPTHRVLTWRPGEPDWADVGSITWRKAQLSALPLPDGTILIAGGGENGHVSELIRLP